MVKRGRGKVQDVQRLEPARGRVRTEKRLEPARGKVQTEKRLEPARGKVRTEKRLEPARGRAQETVRGPGRYHCSRDKGDRRDSACDRNTASATPTRARAAKRLPAAGGHDSAEPGFEPDGSADSNHAGALCEATVICDMNYEKQQKCGKCLTQCAQEVQRPRWCCI